ncbi:hypothetical protein [Ferruginibacter profundus]
MKSAGNKSCPSAVAKPGATLLGVVNSNGVVGYIDTPLTIDETFIEKAGGNDVVLEKSFRFSAACAKTGCRQWSNGTCGVIKKIMTLNPGWHEDHPHLPACSIRNTCRWYFQEGDKACAYCPYVITKVNG